MTPRKTPGLDQVEGLTYTRITEAGARSAAFVQGRIQGEAALDPRFARLFRSHEDWSPPREFVADPLLGPLVARVPGFRPLGCWEPFELCVRTIVGQQVSVAAAGTLMDRVGRRATSWAPEAVAKAELSNLGMPSKRVTTIRALAEAAASGDLPWDAPWSDLREALARLPGFGPWTLGYLGIRLGRDLDALPSSDLGLLRQTGCRTPRELEHRAEAWCPYRGWAAAYLWML